VETSAGIQYSRGGFLLMELLQTVKTKTLREGGHMNMQEVRVRAKKLNL